MFLALNTLQRQMIPSFESIDFKLSQNFISSRNASISIDNDYQPESLTYTETQIGDRLSFKFLELPHHDKQNHNNIQIAINHQNIQPFQKFKNPQFQPEKNIKIKKKKSILVINNIELNCDDTTDRSQEDTKRSNEVNFKRIQRKSSFSKTRPNSASLSTQCSPQVNKISESIIVLNSNSNLVQPTEAASEIKKKSISCMKTQDQSVLESAVKSSSKERLQRSVSQKASCDREVKKVNTRNVSDRYSRRNSTDRVSSQKMQIKVCDINLRRREARRNFMEDGVCLQHLMNVKAIKLQENTDVSRLYLRKIIQNRVSVQHYAESQKNSRKLRE